MLLLESQWEPKYRLCDGGPPGPKANIEDVPIMGNSDVISGSSFGLHWQHSLSESLSICCSTSIRLGRQWVGHRLEEEARPPAVMQGAHRSEPPQLLLWFLGLMRLMKPLLINMELKSCLMNQGGRVAWQVHPSSSNIVVHGSPE